NFDFESHPDLINAKIGYGTRSFLNEKAMSRKECQAAMGKGAEIVHGIQESGSNVIGFGEMGIGNTSSASMLMHAFTGIALQQCIGMGTGVDEAGYQRKLSILSQALETHVIPDDPIEVLSTYGGFEVAMMCGGFLQAAASGMIILVDGFIASAAFLTAMRIEPVVKEYAVFCHQSEEKGHQSMLACMGAKSLLNINMRLGEGTGCAVAYPVLQSAVNFFNDMASFESAGVSEGS
ncbi:MAG: nicotinate-nucleotide--dimethylbenzimidazole phosphoribosyltransferase, partial [Roseivirga sp.]|nr:nicotinate-nucleotide--dimethylbenzimidazole phosphoribosyltransferase [Roseivirga sp.]